MRPEVTISRKHLHTLVSRDGFDLHYIQVCILEKTACGLVSKVMKAEVLDSRRSPSLNHRRRYLLRRQTEHRTADTSWKA